MTWRDSLAMPEQPERLHFPPGLEVHDGVTAICVVEWRVYHGREKLFAYWPAFRLGTYFRDWPTLLDHVLHPLNTHVRLKVRA
jgi:hypothetical protein